MELQFETIDTSRISEKVAEQFMDLIRSGKLKPGDKLPAEQSLAQAMGISRATVREALSGLKALGLVISRSGKGNFIIEDNNIIEDWDRLIIEIRQRSVFFDALEARRALEGEICFLAAERATEEQLEEIKIALNLTKDAVTADDFRQADYRFHHALALASGNQLFICFIEECFVTLTEFYWEIIQKGNLTDNSSFFRDHSSILSCIQERNPVKAREKMVSHIKTIQEVVLSNQR